LVVGMVDEVIACGEAGLLEALDLSKAAETSTEAAKVELATKLSNAEAILAEKTKAVDEKTLANAAAGEKLAAVTVVHSEKLAFQCTGDAAMVELQQSKAAVAVGIEKDLKAIVEGEADCKELLATLQKLSFDESLIKALPGTCSRAPADRGSFDGMVLNQLETSLTQKLVDLSKAVEAEVPGAKERADAVVAAEEQVTAATAFQANAADEQATAEASRSEASVGVEQAAATLAAHEPEESKALTVREQKAAALEEFQKSTRGPFEMLRDRKAGMIVDVPSPEAKVAPSALEGAIPVTVGGA